MNPVVIQLARFVAEYDDLQSILRLEPAHQLDHFHERFRLSAHETPKLSPREGSRLVEDHPAEILLKREFVRLVDDEVQAVPLLHFIPIQLKMFRRTATGMMIPAIGEEDTADVQEQRCDWGAPFHGVVGWDGTPTDLVMA